METSKLQGTFLSYYKRFILLSIVSAHFSQGSISEECRSSWSAMRSDPNFIYVNETTIKLCYVLYQNAIAVDSNGAVDSMVVECKYREYADFCTKYVAGGTTCSLETGWLSLNLCVPGSCSSAEDLSGIVSTFYNPVTSTINCSQPPPSAVLPAILTTVSVLLVTVCLVFSFRPPADVLNSRRAEKAKQMMRALSKEASRQ
jgi:hypothetical protein